ncbi:hypothetical protein LNP26_28345 [Klebsiella variicola subsp. variicola]|nr:hypothetical protein [Klebsiella variicola subsp. variicola]
MTGEERIDISNLQSLQPGATVPVTLTRADGSQEVIPLSVPYRHRDRSSLLLPQRRHPALRYPQYAVK